MPEFHGMFRCCRSNKHVKEKMFSLEYMAQ